MGATLRVPTQLPPPVKVATIKSSTPNLRRECAELGVCQGLEPPCGLCARHTTQQTDYRYGFEDIAYWGAVVVLAAFTVATIAGLAGYISVRFF